ncbi:MAG: ATP-binding protein, partial [Myxococcota bacterium]
MTDRQQRRRGRQASIAGEAADEVVKSLVAQFSDPYAFVRELIQNALDAAASRIELQMTWDGEAVSLAVIDDGEGMDRATIEGYLLVKFRSTKDRDLTKIGKFGIGFVSVFAVQPRRVTVDTGRDSFWHRVTFGPDLRYELREMPDPFEGTTVTVEIPANSRSAAVAVCERVHATAVTWCRFADGVVTTTARGVPNGWDARPIAAPFTVDAPVVVREQAEGFLVVLGPHPSPRPPVGYYNRGLTLWEGEAGVAPGVTFRVDSLHLEHTLTRDNVIQDDAARAVLARVAALAEASLGDAVHRAVAEATTRERMVELFAAIHLPSPWAWRDDLSLPLANGGRVALGALRPSLVARLWAQKPVLVGAGPEAARICDAGHPVLLGHPDDPHVAFVARETGAA